MSFCVFPNSFCLEKLNWSNDFRHKVTDSSALYLSGNRRFRRCFVDQLGPIVFGPWPIGVPEIGSYLRGLHLFLVAKCKVPAPFYWAGTGSFRRRLAVQLSPSLSVFGPWPTGAPEIGSYQRGFHLFLVSCWSAGWAKTRQIFGVEFP